jgi:hypothetical protein
MPQSITLGVDFDGVKPDPRPYLTPDRLRSATLGPVLLHSSAP